jgi:F-type H+-transporting ATPase subunit delta
MKINKEIRRVSKQLLRASFTDGQLDQGKIMSLIESLISKKPRYYIAIVENYKRLLRLEVEKRHAQIESANEISPEVSSKIVSSLKRNYGNDLSAAFVVNPELLGGIRVRVGSDVWDGTVRNRLQRLQEQL